MTDAATEDKLRRALARLTAIKTNTPPQPNYIGERIVEEYHTALRHLADLGLDTGEFKISENDINPRIVGWAPRHRGRPSAPEFSLDRSTPLSLFLIHLDAVLGYFSLTTAAPNEQIAFTVPKAKDRKHNDRSAA